MSQNPLDFLQCLEGSIIEWHDLWQGLLSQTWKRHKWPFMKRKKKSVNFSHTLHKHTLETNCNVNSALNRILCFKLHERQKFLSWFAVVFFLFLSKLRISSNCTNELLNVSVVFHRERGLIQPVWKKWLLQLQIKCYYLYALVDVRLKYLPDNDCSLFLCLSLFHSACEGRHVWGDRRPSLLQQEQDWGKISNSQMFLFPGTSSGNHPCHALLCGRCVSIHFSYALRLQ